MPGYVVDEPLIAAPWDWGRLVFTGAMAEHEELEAIKPRIATIEQQLNSALAEINETNARLEQSMALMEENMNKALSKSYRKGFVDGGVLGFVLGIGLGVWIAD
jgi:hypothetical protein